MVLKEASLLDDDTSTAFTCATPPETVITDLQDFDHAHENDNVSSASVPSPGSTFLIRSVKSGKLITLCDGRIQLLSPGSRGSIHWHCSENQGWLGFRNTTSNLFLGHNFWGNLVCDGPNHAGWENMCARAVPEGGYVLMMTHWWSLWHVGVKWVENGEEHLGKIGGGVVGGMVWEFVKV